jgi:predicted metalloendopeptidase
MVDYDMDCPAAYKRLVEIGVPATIEHSVSSNSSSKTIAETVQFFITLMDSLKLNVTAVDEIFPQLSDLMQTINRADLKNLLKKSKDKIKEWLITLNKMK